MTQKNAMVTGASSGIGLEFVRQLAQAGYCITAVARREERLIELIRDLPGKGHRYLLSDLANDDDVDTLTQVLLSQRFQVLINNAGYSVMAPFAESPLQDQQNILQVNCTALVALAHAFLNQAEAGDSLVNLASVVAYMPTPAQPMYCATKSFIAALSECLWEEQRHKGVYVLGLCPGATSTEFMHTATGGESDGRRLPEAMTQSAEEVVNEAMAAMTKRKKGILVTGRSNRLLMSLPRLLSRHSLIKLLAVAGDPKRSLQ